MKKTILVAMISIPVALSAQEAFTLKGKAGDLKSPAKAYLNYRTEAAAVLDSAEIVDGTFTFQGNVESPTRAQVLLAHKGEDIRQIRNPDRVEFYLEAGEITINTSDSLHNAKIVGGTTNESHQLYLDLTKEHRSKMDGLNAQFMSASDEQRQDQSFVANLQQEAAKIQKSQKQVDLDFIALHRDSPVSLNLLSQYVNSEPLGDVIEPLYANLSEDLQNSSSGIALQEQITNMKNVEIGAMAPEFAQPDADGNMIALSSLRGQYVLIDFWASWCGPCRQENPNVVAAYHKFKDKDFTIFGVSLDRPGQKEAWLKAIEDDGLEDWPNVSELKFWDSDVVKMYAIRGIPQNFLLDPEGKIIAKNLRGEALHRKLEEVLN